MLSFKTLITSFYLKLASLFIYRYCSLKSILLTVFLFLFTFLFALNTFAYAVAFKCSKLLEGGGKHGSIEFIDSIELCLIFGNI